MASVLFANYPFWVSQKNELTHFWLSLHFQEFLMLVDIYNNNFHVKFICFLYNTLQPFYNMVPYNMVFGITRLKDGSQKCIDYIEK